MDVQIIASSSKGNCYALRCDDSVLLLEAGVPIARLRKKLTAGLSRCVACLVTHEHNDHAGYAKQYMEAGIPVCASLGTCSAIGVGRPITKSHRWSYRCHDLRMQDWKVSIFSVRHDAADPLGFLIDAPDGTRLVFAIDSFMLPYKFPGVNVWMLECNYDLALLEANIAAGEVDSAQAKRILQSHMSVDHVAAFLQAQDLSKTRAVYLLHGSDRNLNKQDAVDKIRGVVGVPVYMEGL